MRAVALLSCLVLAGCGLVSGGPSSAPTRTPVQQRIATAQATHEYPSSHPPRQRVQDYSPLAAESIIAFATEYINWNAQTVSANLRMLAAESVGQAHSAMEMAAAGTGRDYELDRAGIANHGVIEAVGPLTGHPGQWVVVTKETTTATASNAYQGLQPEWHVTVASAVELSPGHWAINYWQPEN